MVYVNLRNEKKITWAKYLTAMSTNKKFLEGFFGAEQPLLIAVAILKG